MGHTQNKIVKVSGVCGSSLKEKPRENFITVYDCLCMSDQFMSEVFLTYK